MFGLGREMLCAKGCVITLACGCEISGIDAMTNSLDGMPTVWRPEQNIRNKLTHPNRGVRRENRADPITDTIDLVVIVLSEDDTRL